MSSCGILRRFLAAGQMPVLQGSGESLAAVERRRSVEEAGDV
ncbi:hypothetical protein [Novosphingobium sp.]|nr:hypothetical protein [Novosphingobium sp.]